MKKLYFLIFFFSISSQLFAQDKEPYQLWAEFGLGADFAKFSESDVGLGLRATLNYEIQNNNFSISVLHSSEFLSFDDPLEYIRSYELKYGRSFDFSTKGLIFPSPLLLLIDKEFHCSFLAKIGVSYIEAIEGTVLIRNEPFNSVYDKKLLHGFGLPIEIELRQEITDFLGMGLSFYANINEVSNYWGFNLSIHAGYF